MVDFSAHARGRWGEQRARRHLERIGYIHVASNWRSPERNVRGEIDLIVRDGATIVFCEVKARRSTASGGAIGAITPAKQARIRHLAASWLRLHPTSCHNGVRFDIITIDGVRLRHWENAFVD